MSFVVVLMILIGCKPSDRQQTDVSHEAAGYSYPTKHAQVMQTYQYQGIIPEAEGNGILFDLSISRNEYSSDGKYILITTHQQINNRRQKSDTSRGYLEVQRGNANDPNATIYKLTDEIDDNVLYLQVMRNNRLRLLTHQQLPDSIIEQSGFNYDLELVP